MSTILDMLSKSFWLHLTEQFSFWHLRMCIFNPYFVNNACLWSLQRALIKNELIACLSFYTANAVFICVMRSHTWNGSIQNAFKHTFWLSSFLKVKYQLIANVSSYVYAYNSIDAFYLNINVLKNCIKQWTLNTFCQRLHGIDRKTCTFQNLVHWY